MLLSIYLTFTEKRLFTWAIKCVSNMSRFWSSSTSNMILKKQLTEHFSSQI